MLYSLNSIAFTRINFNDTSGNALGVEKDFLKFRKPESITKRIALYGKIY